MRRSLIAILLLTGVVLADDWPQAQVQNVFSDNGRYFVRIIPGNSFGDTAGFSGSPKGPYARGEFYTQQTNRSYKLIADVELVNPVSPVEALVTNDGDFLTFDNWHNFGFGKVVAIYRPNGKLFRAFALEDIYGPTQLDRIPQSVSSRWWRCAPHGYSDPAEQTTVYAFEHFGGTFVFNVKTGSVKYARGSAKCNPPRGPFSASWIGSR